jgi:WD40 repeat protein
LSAANEVHTPSKRKVSKKCEVGELKFSPSGAVLAVGCKDNLIHLLSAADHFKRVGVCRGHSAFIRHLDFSADGAVLQSSDAARELLHWDAATGQRLMVPAQFRDAQWSTYSNVYGWSVQGVFNNSEGVAAIDGDINCVDRSPDGQWLVSGGSHTVHHAIKLFNYPCLPDAIPSFHGGHTSPVLDVKIVSGPDGSLELASAGGNDSCMFQWRILGYK